MYAFRGKGIKVYPTNQLFTNSSLLQSLNSFNMKFASLTLLASVLTAVSATVVPGASTPLFYLVASWPSSPPHWLSRKRNTGHMKPPSPSYFVDFRCLYRSNGLIDKTLAAVDGFSHALAVSVFDSLWMYSFCGALTSLFYVLLVTFYFLLVFYCSLCSSLIFTWP